MSSWHRVQNTVILSGELSPEFDVPGCLSDIGDAQDLELVINSHGGDAITGLALLDGLRGRVGRARIVGTCASAAWLPILSAKTIACDPRARLMIHGPAICRFGFKSALEDAAVMCEVVGEKMIAAFVARGVPAEIVAPMITDEKDHWLTPSQAFELAIVDEILPTPERAPTDPEDVTLPPREDSKVALALELLNALGDIKTDRRKFAAELNRWLDLRVRQ